ncbi:hypothetical protein MA16_Dca021620 [Dendrobium catenatum]|uniref:Uncharacterized protein n=2 Tax=Dendrobium catenatum TaxID=906689 RepID=A0A2I0WEX0_9ASPA|nr:hypothetical protein MA16_Dca021620 [Dendrobium catenatum]
MKGGSCYKEAGLDACVANTKHPQWGNKASSSSPQILRFCSSRSLVCVVIFSGIVFFYMFTFTVSPFSCSNNPIIHSSDSEESSAIIRISTFNSSRSSMSSSSPPLPSHLPPPASPATMLRHIVFGIAASKNFWESRKEYIKIWWQPRKMRGFVWLDEPVNEPRSSASSLPIIKISANTSNFPYTHKHGSRSALRISRIVAETVRLNLADVRWFVMGDDDTVFIPDNLIRVLNKLDHRQPYYIGSQSESHLQNIIFSYAMAYGGGGFAISRPLAISLAQMQDRCIHRYPALYGSDDRIQACMAELGVPLTRHPGFHQFDVYGDLLGLLAAHPIAPLVTLHHLDLVDAIFPNSQSRAEAINRLFDGPVRLDSAGVMQQSICYDVKRHWTLSVSWGFVVQVVRGVMSPREMERPARTFLNWYRRADYKAYAFNTRPVARNPCQKPFLYYLSSSSFTNSSGMTVTRYSRYMEQPHPICRWKLPDPAVLVNEVVVFKKPDPALWNRAPRRNCCRVISSSKAGNKKAMTLEVGVCRDGEIAGAR